MASKSDHYRCQNTSAQLWEIYTERELHFFAVILFASTPSPLPLIGTDSPLTPSQREERLRKVRSFWFCGSEGEWRLKQHTFSKIMCIFINYYFLCAVNADHTSILQYTEREWLCKKRTEVYLNFSNHCLFLMEQVVQIISTRLKLYTEMYFSAGKILYL